MTAVLHLHRLAYATTDAQAVLIAQTALDDGADPRDVIAALVEWWEMHKGDVQRIESSAVAE